MAQQELARRSILIESHQAPPEHYGLQITGPNSPTIQRINPVVLACSHASMEVTGAQEKLAETVMKEAPCPFALTSHAANSEG